ncbi:MAG: site-specific DNA-methyltransferase [Bacillota bacterium]|nr:site-specific DNA-methyltransferase [Bacillota bacterium]
MIWQRADCFREINDSQQDGGLLICGDAGNTDLSAFYGKVQTVYLDPPGVSGATKTLKQRVGEAGWASSRQSVLLPVYQDYSGPADPDYLEYLRRMLVLAHDLLTPEGSVFVHLEVDALARGRLLMDEVFGASNFRNQLIWSYQTGGRSKRFFSRKHDAILFYAKSEAHYFDITRVPVARKETSSNHLKRHVDEKGRSYRSIISGGKKYIYYDDEPVYPDDVWSDVSQMQQKDPQRTGYPTQKPQSLLDRIILSTTRPGDLVADLTCGSGTTLQSAAVNGRRFLGVDKSALSFAVSRKRLSPYRLVCQAPFDAVDALVDASCIPGIGFYTVILNAYTTAPEDYDKVHKTPKNLDLSGLETVDQWYAGLINKGEFVAYASSLRAKQTPALERSLEVPLLRGTVAILIIDVLGRRSLWTSAPQI